MRRLVAATALTAAFSSVAYELLLASYATFLWGGTVLHYSLVFSLMMASMGVGARLAQSRKQDAFAWLVRMELVIASLAAIAIPLLYALYAVGGPAQVVLLFFVVAMGCALGMEIPLLNNLEKSNRLLTDILFFDYLGGFIGGLVFPFWLQPHLGFFRLSALLGCINALVALALLRRMPRRVRGLVPLSIAVAIGCVVSLCFAEPIRLFLESHYFGIRHG